MFEKRKTGKMYFLLAMHNKKVLVVEIHVQTYIYSFCIKALSILVSSNNC